MIVGQNPDLVVDACVQRDDRPAPHPQQLLHRREGVISGLRRDSNEHPALLPLGIIYQNLLRRLAET